MSSARLAALGIAAFLAASAQTRARGSEDPGSRLLAREVPSVTVVTRSQRIRGCPLPSNPEVARRILCIAADTGHLETLEYSMVQKVIPEDLRDVAGVSSAALVQGLALEDRTTREYCEGLLECQERRATAALLQGLAHPSPEVRWRCLKLLEEIPEECNAAHLRGLLRDPVARVRRYALAAYVAADPAERLAACESVFTFESATEVLHEAVVQIGSCGEARAVDALLDLLRRCEERSVKIQIFASLRRITGQNFGRTEEGWSAWWTNHRSEWVQPE